MKIFKTCIFLACALALCILLLPLNTELPWEKAVEYMVMWLTICGFAITIWQIYQIKNQNALIDKTAKETKAKIENIDIVFDLASQTEKVMQTIGYINSQKWEIAHLRLNDIYATIGRIGKEPSKFGISDREIGNILNNTSNDLRLLNTAINNPQRVDVEVLRNHLDELKLFLSLACNHKQREN